MGASHGRPVVASPDQLMTAFPRDTRLDSTLALLSEGYTFISSRCRRYGSDVFETRLMLRQAVCVLGEDAARMFYVPDRFTRRGALPPTTLWLLQDEGSASVLDGEAHRWRKQLFMSLMTPAHLQRLVDQVVDQVVEQWRLQMAAWERSERVVLHQAVQEV